MRMVYIGLPTQILCPTAQHSTDTLEIKKALGKLKFQSVKNFCKRSQNFNMIF